jgi:hypothetical protein
MLLGAGGVFLPLAMVAFAVMFSGGTVCLGSIFVMVGCFAMFVSSHYKPLWLFAPSPSFKTLRSELFLDFCNAVSNSFDARCDYWWRRPVPLMNGHHAGWLCGWQKEENPQSPQTPSHHSSPVFRDRRLTHPEISFRRSCQLWT